VRTMARKLGTIELPRLLYGDAATTRRALRRLLGAAWTHGSFAPVVDGLEKVPVDDLPGEIIISNVRRDGFRNHETLWWPIWVATERPRGLRRLPAQLPVSAKWKALLLREQSLICDGMTHLWFVVGMLEEGVGVDRYVDYARIQSPVETCEALELPMLRGFIHWLPALLELRDRFASVAIHYSNDALTRHFWLSGILGLATQCGYRFDPVDWFTKINDKFDGDPIAALIDFGMIRPVGDRWELREAKP
jgi:hypothetical protein